MTLNTRLILLLLTTLQWVAYGQREQPTCPRGCRVCSNGAADCSSADLTVVPKGFDPKTNTINLNSNRFTKLDETSFEKTEVLTMMLGLNQIQTIGANTFLKLETLVTLDMARNKINDIHPSGFEGLINLRTLSLASNQLTSITGVMDKLSLLSSLNLAHNMLTTIGENDFPNNVHMRMLDLSHNKISSIHSDAFFTLKRLRYLILASNPLVTVDKFNMGQSMLQLLDLTGCMLQKVPLGIPGSVSDLRLANNHLQELNRTSFENATGLRLIALNNNQIKAIEDGTFRNSKHLGEIWINNNKMKYIPNQLPSNIKALHMDSNKVVKVENSTFYKNSTVEYISAQSNAIESMDKNAFQNLKNLSRINFHSNKIKIIEPNTFTNLPNLKSISLSNNPLKEIKRNALKSLPSLEEISFSYDTQQSVKIGYNMLKEIPNVKKINIISSPGMAKAFLLISRRFKKPIMKGTKQVNLMYNDLKSIPRALRRKFPKLSALMVEGNIFKCDKRLLWLKRWIKKYKLTTHIVEEPQCFMPEVNRGQSLIRLADAKYLKSSRKPKKVIKKPTSNDNEAVAKQPKKSKSNNVRYRKKRKKTNGLRQPRTGRIRKTRKKNRKPHVQPKKMTTQVSKG